MTARPSCGRCAACGLDEERAYSLEYRVQGRDGAYIEVEDTGRVIDTGKSGAIRIIGMLKDVTERKRAQFERERLNAQLREAQKVEALGTMAGGIAHDFNNILGAILGHGELALDDAREQERRSEAAAGHHRRRPPRQGAGRADPDVCPAWHAQPARGSAVAGGAGSA